MSYKNVIVETHDSVGLIRLNRPEALNALNSELIGELNQALDAFEQDAAIGCIVLTGSEKAFAAGADIGEMAEATPVDMLLSNRIGQWDRVRRISKPVIAAVNGVAMGGGFEIALACDLIVAAEDAKFGIPEAKRGLVAAAGGLVRLPNQIPERVAMELALTGEFISARRAYEIGLINAVVAPGTALEAARALAAKIVANGPLAVAASKRIIVESRDWPAAEAFKRQSAVAAPIFSSEDAIEGSRAFAEKRAPNWKGK